MNRVFGLMSYMPWEHQSLKDIVSRFFIISVTSCLLVCSDNPSNNSFKYTTSLTRLYDLWSLWNSTFWPLSKKYKLVKWRYSCSRSCAVCVLYAFTLYLQLYCFTLPTLHHVYHTFFMLYSLSVVQMGT